MLRKSTVRSPILSWVLALATLGFATAATVVSHTDDGCAIELHCFACHWATVTISELTPPVDPGPALEPAGPGDVECVPRVVEAPAPAVASRGPPSH